MKKHIYKLRLFISGIVLILAFLALFRIYPVKIMDIQFSALFQRTIYDFSIISCILFLILILTAFFFGRIYCGVVCPFGILQEFFALIVRKKGEKCYKLPLIKYLISSLAFGFLIGGSAVLISYIDPYAIFSNAVSLSIFGIIFLTAILIIVFFKNRYFCTSICPVGAILGLISKISLYKINVDKNKCISCSICAKNCPAGAIDYKNKTIDNSICIKCLKCLEVCKKDAINFGANKEKPVFKPKRREFIQFTISLAFFLASIKAGADYAIKYCSKIKNVILPAGAKNANTLANKCFNCNLCIKSCPSKILAKKDSEFPAVHIDYTKGKGFCDYNCIECSRVCPAGAIKKITLKEKQNTAIAIAAIDDNLCKNCSICLNECPKSAIYKENDKIKIDHARCIGCAKCSAYCPSGAIKIYSINEQRII